MPASFGLLLPTREMVMTGQSSKFGSIIELAKEAEESGFDSVWVGDSLLARPRFEPLTTLAAVATATTRIKLIPGAAISTSVVIALLNRIPPALA